MFGTCLGALAEYACASESALVIKPDHLTFEQAASLPVASFTALQGLRDKGRTRPGQKVLVNGAAGGVGTFAVQIARSFGAEVTGVCSTRNVEMVRSLGADRVVDYTQEDFTSGRHRYDVIFDCVGNHSFSACRRVLTADGTLIAVGGPTGRWMIVALSGAVALIVRSRFTRQKFVLHLARPRTEDLIIMCDLMKAGKVTPVIDTCYRLSDAPEAIRYLEAGHARGKVVVTV